MRRGGMKVLPFNVSAVRSKNLMYPADSLPLKKNTTDFAWRKLFLEENGSIFLHFLVQKKTGVDTFGNR